MSVTIRLHHGEIRWIGSEDADTIRLLTDLGEVSSSVHQSMPIVGPWFEERIRSELKKRLPSGWAISGPSQIFDRGSDGIRSRSWDLVIHRQPADDLPPPASPSSGYPLLPKEAVAAVIDTKTMFADVEAYASKNALNLMNDHPGSQLTFLGNGIRTIILAASSTISTSKLRERGKKCGMDVFSLGRTKTDPVKFGKDRRWQMFPEMTPDNEWPLTLFYRTVFEAIERYDRHKPEVF